jgi:hypothetical protein
MRIRLTTAVDEIAILPAVVVVKAPVGIIVMVFIPAAGVIVAIAVVPLTKKTGVVGAIVVALAIVGAVEADVE